MIPAIALGLWRVQDGGYPRKIAGSNILGYLLCILFATWHFQNIWIGATVGLIYGYTLNLGYADWNSRRLMAVRPWPVSLAILLVLFLHLAGAHSATISIVGVLPLVVFGNVIQPWLRAKLASLGHWSNRTAEFIEAACLGASIWLL